MCRLDDPRATADFRVSSRQLSLALFTLAVVDVFPIAVGFAQTREVHRWMPVIGSIAMLTFAMATLLIQATDWSAARAAAWFTAVMTLVYATSTGVGLFANGTNRLVIGLDLTQSLLNRRLALWSLLQLASHAALTFALGRCADRWQRALRPWR